MGVGPVGWRDIEAWQACTGTPLPAWRARMLIQLSREYASFSAKAEKPDCPPPWVEVMTADRREAIAKSLTTGFKALMMRR